MAASASSDAATFGKTRVGAIRPTGGGFSADVKRCTKYSLGQTADVSKLTLYTAGVAGYGPSQVVRAIIYATANGVPTTRKAVSNELRVYETDVPAWRTLALPAAVRLAAGTYCLGVISGQTEGGAAFYYDSAAGSWFKNADLYGDGASDPFGTSESGDIQLSIYATYTPYQRCDKTLASGETLAAFLDRLPAWGHGCIRGGSYSTSPWGASLSNFKTGQTLKAKIDTATGKMQRVTLNGSVWTRHEATDVTFEDLTFQGIDDKANVIFLRGDRTRVRFSAITTKCGSDAQPPPRCGQMGIAIGDNAAGWKIERSRIYRLGLNTRFDHGIYCASARGGTVEGNWLYDNASYAFHWYPDCDGTDVRYNIADGNGNGMVFGGEGTDHSDSNVLHNGIISNSTSGDPGMTVHCYLPGTGNAMHDINLFPTTNDCDEPELSRWNIISADPLYVNPTARDYRLRSGSPARTLMGSFATAIPGPRT